MQRVHSCYCHLNLERRDLRAATQRSACLQSNSACCQNRAPPEFRGTKPHGNSAKIILFFQIPLLGQEIHRGSADFPETGQERTRPPRYPFPAQVSLPGCHSAAVVSRRAIPPENVGHFPTGKTRNARRGYISASNVPNTRRICSPLSGLATYPLAPAAKAFCRSRS